MRKMLSVLAIMVAVATIAMAKDNPIDKAMREGEYSINPFDNNDMAYMWELCKSDTRDVGSVEKARRAVACVVVLKNLHVTSYIQEAYITVGFLAGMLEAEELVK